MRVVLVALALVVVAAPPGAIACGAKFLPMCPTPAAPREVMRDAPAAILFVVGDDSPLAQDVLDGELELALLLAGHDVVRATSIADAMARLDAEPIHAVLGDAEQLDALMIPDDGPMLLPIRPSGNVPGRSDPSIPSITPEDGPDDILSLLVLSLGNG